MHKDDFFLKLSWAFSGSGFDSIYDLEVPENVYTSLIYNTNDLCLNKAQFGVLMEFLLEQWWEVCLPLYLPIKVLVE